jgi:hypothetical protein
VTHLRGFAVLIPDPYSLTPLRPPILLDDPDGNPVELFQPAS